MILPWLILKDSQLANKGNILARKNEESEKGLRYYWMRRDGR
jgi:hypothetical protein